MKLLLPTFAVIFYIVFACCTPAKPGKSNSVAETGSSGSSAATKGGAGFR